MKYINLIYWNDCNFGDELSPIIVEKLSGCFVRYKQKVSFLGFCKAVLCCNFRKLKSALYPFQKSFSAVGSIINLCNKNTTVWGSGFMNGDEYFRGGRICALRGKLSCEKLKKETKGKMVCDVWGDPALLLPLLYVPSSEKKYNLGIIPHYSETSFFYMKYGDNYKVIDLHTKEVKSVIDEITSCMRIVSSSLHGIIVAHAYGIPALWVQNNYIDTDGFKFYDYFSSVDIPCYEGYKNYDEIITDKTYQDALFEKDKYSLPNCAIKDIQLNLLRAFPYPLSQEAKKILDELKKLNE